MDPLWLFPALALVFAGLSVVQRVRRGRFGHPAARAWLILALVFGAVSVWLHLHRP
jgi:DMSO reductase anchor subunit